MNLIRWIYPSGQHDHSAVGVLSFNADSMDYRVTSPSGRVYIIPRSCSIIVEPVEAPNV